MGIKPCLNYEGNLADVKILKELETSAEVDLCNFLRMVKECFYGLLCEVSPTIAKKQTLMRDPISSHQRLAVILRFLCYEDLRFLTQISPQTTGKIVIDTCEAINIVL